MSSWLGFFVMRKDEEHPKGKAISGRLQTRSGAEAFLALAEKQAAKEKEDAKFYIEEKIVDHRL